MPLRLRRQLHELGIPVTQARTASFRQLVLQAPPPVVARALGYDYGTAAGHATAAGGTWNRSPGRPQRLTVRHAEPGSKGMTRRLAAALRAATDRRLTSRELPF
jgi:hypothetical protein